MVLQNIERLNNAFQILLPEMSNYIVSELKKIYGNKWVGEAANALITQKGVPTNGSEQSMIAFLDIANCLRLIDRKWTDVFIYSMKDKQYRIYANELMGIRNIVAHATAIDIDNLSTERYLDTMARMCSKINKESEKEIRKIFWDLRNQSPSDDKVNTKQVDGQDQPASFSNNAEIGSGGLLSMVGTDLVQKTTLTRKITFGGKTTVYPVYKVKLDLLYFNDQNDRIATWISKYEAENGDDSLTSLSKQSSDIYNRVIEDFVFDSNPDALQKTKKNIEAIGQREPGVTLPDGRVVDGNRRFTSLRMIQRDKPDEVVYFETIIMELDIEADKKQIKLLELAIQHGEEKKVDYDKIDFCIGTYRDIVKTKLLSIDEYIACTNETKSDVKKRIDSAGLISDFLEHIGLDEQYYIARDYQMYSVYEETLPIMKGLKDEDKKILKYTIHNNALLNAIADQRKFIRDIKNLVKSDDYKDYFDEQTEFNTKVKELIAATPLKDKDDMEKFAKDNEDLAEEMRISMERALQRYRAHQLKEKPAENVSKSIDLLLNVDTRFFKKLNPDDKEALANKLDELGNLVSKFKKLL